MPDLVAAWRRSTVAELSWVGPETPDGLAVVPLVWNEQPSVALPFSHVGVAETLTGRRAVFSVTDVVTGAKSAVASSGLVDVRMDTDGSVFVEHLLAQEAAKHAPTRLRADSLVARRENWWWVPRAIVTLTEPERVRELHGRSRPNDALLVRERDGSPEVEVVTAATWAAGVGEHVSLYARDGFLLDGDDESVLVFSHQHSPDFERWERWFRAGRLRGEELTITAADGTPADSLRPFGLLDRYRNHRGLARACKAGIAAAERS